MKYKVLLFFSVYMLFSCCEAKEKKRIDLKNARIAVVMNLDNEIGFAKNALTIFGIKNYSSPDNIFDFKSFIYNRLSFILESITHQDIQQVEKISLSTHKQLKKYKRKERRKILENEKKLYYEKLMNQGITHLISIQKSDFHLSNAGAAEPVIISGYGVYRNIETCSFFMLDVSLISLSSTKENHFIIKYPQTMRDESCYSGQNLEKHSIKFKKKYDLYSSEEIEGIINIIKQQVAPSIAISFLKSGLIKDELLANMLVINSALDEYLVIEKYAKNIFNINGKHYTSNELKENLIRLLKKKKVNKILVGLKSKSFFTFGDVTKIIKPVLKGSDTHIFRTGKKNELILIK